MFLPQYGPDCAEGRLLATIIDLSHRILYTQDQSHRDELRATIEGLRAELIKLIVRLPVPSEVDVLERTKAQAMVAGTRPPLMTV